MLICYLSYGEIFTISCHLYYQIVEKYCNIVKIKKVGLIHEALDACLDG